MTNLMLRDNLFQSLFDFRRDFDQIFNRMLGGTPFGEGQPSAVPVAVAPAVESYIDKSGKTFHCRMNIPGVDPSDVQIQAQGNTLTVQGERKFNQSASEAEFLHNEILYGKFERMLTLPEGIDAVKLNAEYRNGVLEITAPIAASALPRRIEIKTAPLTKQMSA